MTAIVDWLNDILWGNALVYLILLAGLFFTITTRFVQLRYVKDMVSILIKGEKSDSGITPFQALTLSLSGRIGVGNIVGVATAIAVGGPGAIFWMWVTGFVGAATAFIETTLAQTYKLESDKKYRGGVPYIIDKGLNIRWFAIIVAVIALISYTLLIPGLQANSISDSVQNAFGIPQWVSGLVIVGIVAAVILGGVKRIASFSAAVVPFMSIGYVLIAIIIILVNIADVPTLLSLIFSSAFGVDATFGGIIGAAIAWGVRRAILSNGAGFGEGTYYSAAAEASHPVKQGLVQSFSVYIDTLIVCTATGLMILITGMYNVTTEAGEAIVNNIPQMEAGAINPQLAFDTVFSGFGSIFIAISIFFFALTTLLAFSYVSETALIFLTKERIPWLDYTVKSILIIVIFYGSVESIDLIWAIGDVGYAVMAWLNIIAMILLAKPALKIFKDYELQRSQGLEPIFDPKKIGIKGATFWEKKLDKSNK